MKHSKCLYNIPNPRKYFLPKNNQKNSLPPPLVTNMAIFQIPNELDIAELAILEHNFAPDSKERVHENLDLKR